MSERNGRKAQRSRTARRGTGLIAVALLVLATLLAFGLDVLVARTDADLQLENQPGFFAAFGAVSALTAAVIARVMRLLLGRSQQRLRLDRHYVDDHS